MSPYIAGSQSLWKFQTSYITYIVKIMWWGLKGILSNRSLKSPKIKNLEQGATPSYQPPTLKWKK